MFTFRKQLYQTISGEKVHKNRIWIFIMMGSLYMGYEYGKSNSKQLDLSKLIECKGQDEQIYHLLEEKPLIQLFYAPGDARYDLFRTQVIQASHKFSEVNFMLVNCHQHYQYCRNIDFPRLPMLQMTMPEKYPTDKLPKYRMDGIFPQVEFKKDHTVEGIEHFLRDNQVLEPIDYAKNMRNKLPNIK